VALPLLPETFAGGVGLALKNVNINWCFGYSPQPRVIHRANPDKNL